MGFGDDTIVISHGRSGDRTFAETEVQRIQRRRGHAAAYGALIGGTAAFALTASQACRGRSSHPAARSRNGHQPTVSIRRTARRQTHDDSPAQPQPQTSPTPRRARATVVAYFTPSICSSRCARVMQKTRRTRAIPAASTRGGFRGGLRQQVRERQVIMVRRQLAAVLLLLWAPRAHRTRPRHRLRLPLLAQRRPRPPVRKADARRRLASSM
jgi:hypothetical protein